MIIKTKGFLSMINDVDVPDKDTDKDVLKLLIIWRM